jgi:hypothetical protein
MSIPFVLVLVLAVITVVGHLIWVVIRALFLGIMEAGDDWSNRPVPAMLCPRCQEAWKPNDATDWCPVCGWSVTGEWKRERPDGALVLAALRRKVEHFHQCGLIDAALKAQVMSALRLQPGTPAKPAASREASQGMDPDPRKPAAGLPSDKQPEIAFVEHVTTSAAPAQSDAVLLAQANEAAVARAQKFRSVIEEAAAVPPPVVKKGPEPPTKPFFQFLAAFLEEKNIRWGELVGGLLIVGCSIALVLSFWSSIAERPFLKFGLFHGMTALLFLLGFHVASAWKLPTTSRGLLIIASLLTPLNFLAVAALGRGPGVETLADLAGEAVTVGVFAVLTFHAGTLLAALNPLSLTIGMIVPSALLLVIRRCAQPDDPAVLFFGIAALPIFVQNMVTAVVLRVRGDAEISESSARDLLQFLGLTTFATLTALGLVVGQNPPLDVILHRLAWLVPLVGAPALAIGMLIWKRTTAPELAGYRTAGTALAAVGVLILLAGLGLSWPTPAMLIRVALIDFVVLTLLTLTCHVPAVHVLAGSCLTIAALVGLQVATGVLPWNGATSSEVASALFSSRSGSLLVPIVLILGVAATVAGRIGRRFESQAYVLVTLIAGSCSLALVTWNGFGRAGDPGAVAWVYAVYAIIALSFAGIMKKPILVDQEHSLVEAQALAWLGSLLLFTALVQGFVYSGIVPGLALPWVVAFLVHSGLFTTVLFAINVNRSPNEPSDRLAITGAIIYQSAMVTAILAAAGLLLAIPSAQPTALLVRLSGLAMVLLALSWQSESAAVFAGFQAALCGVLIYSVSTVVTRQPWYGATAQPWLDPWMLQLQAIALSVLGLGWTGIRRLLHSIRIQVGTKTHWVEKLHALLNPPWLTVDRISRWVPLLVLVTLTIAAVTPGTLLELAISSTHPPRPGAIDPDSGFLLKPHQHASGIGSWLLLGIVLFESLAYQWGSLGMIDLAVATATAMLAAPLFASQFESVVAVATAWRWTSSILLFGLSSLVWSRNGLAAVFSRSSWPAEAKSKESIRPVTQTLLVLGLLPVLMITLYVACASVIGKAVLGPDPTSTIGYISTIPSYVVPIVLIAVTLIGYAFRERDSNFAFAAGLFLNLAATIAVLFSTAGSGASFGTDFFTYLALCNAITSSLYALSWMGTIAACGHSTFPLENCGKRLEFTLTIGAVPVLVAWFAAAVAVFLEPAPVVVRPHWISLIGGLIGWAAFGSTASAAGLYIKLTRKSVNLEWYAFAIIAAGLFLPLNLATSDVGDWRTYHGLLVGQSIAAILIPLFGWYSHRLRQEPMAEQTRIAVIRWTTLAISLVLVLAFRAVMSDPQRPWWTLGGMVAMAPVVALLAVYARNGSVLFGSALLINLAGSFWFVTAASRLWRIDSPLDLVSLNVLLMMLPVPIWRKLQETIERETPARLEQAWHRMAPVISLAGLTLVVSAGLVCDVDGTKAQPITVLGWSALGATMFALVTNLFDARARLTIICLYAAGLCGVGWTVHQFHPTVGTLVTTGTIVLAAYSVATSYLWSRRAGLRAFAHHLGLPTRHDVSVDLDHYWIVSANLAVATAVTLLGFGTILDQPDGALRFAAAQAVLSQTLAIGLLARGERRSGLQMLCLVVGAIGLVGWGWAGIAPGSPSGTLDRLVVVFVSLVGTSVAYGLGLGKFLRTNGDWLLAARRLVPSLLFLGAMSLLAVLGVELRTVLMGQHVLISPWAITAVALALMVAFAAGIVAALVPGRDPLELSEYDRAGYVYAGEVTLFALVVHLRLTMPWLFAGFFDRYWALIVMGVAFCGVGLSEVFRRTGRNVLADPIERSIPFLPLLPILGALRTIPEPGQDTLFLIVTGALYSTMALWRSKPGFGILAILAYNAALWTVLGRWPGYGLLEHPQLWIIPPAICVLIAGQLNRDRLSPSQLTSIRYGAAMAIYLASTADIALTGVSREPWLPLVLGGLALLGLFAGILLRARGFLFLGFGFLLLALFTMIWHAAVDLEQTWIWWACGIIAGLLILGMVALFEKKRLEILRLVDQLRDWNA